MPRHNYVQIRLTDEEKQVLTHESRRHSLPLAIWIRLILRERAKVLSQSAAITSATIDDTHIEDT